jgi:hypothetical protein
MLRSLFEVLTQIFFKIARFMYEKNLKRNIKISLIQLRLSLVTADKLENARK